MPAPGAARGCDMSVAVTAADQGRPEYVDLDCHVLPLLDAVVWMGHASNRLTEIDAIKGCMPNVLACLDDLVEPERLNAGELISGVTWVAASLLRRYQEEQDGVMAGGAA